MRHFFQYIIRLKYSEQLFWTKEFFHAFGMGDKVKNNCMTGSESASNPGKEKNDDNFNSNNRGSGYRVYRMVGNDEE